MGSQTPANSPRPRPKVVYKKGIAEERATRRVCSWTGQNEMKNIPSWLTAEAV